MKFIRLLMIIGMLLQPGSAVFGMAAEPPPIIAVCPGGEGSEVFECAVGAGYCR